MSSGRHFRTSPGRQIGTCPRSHIGTSPGRSNRIFRGRPRDVGGGCPPNVLETNIYRLGSYPKDILFQSYLWKSSLRNYISIHIIIFAVLSIYCYFNVLFLLMTARKMKINYIFPRKMFSSKNSARANILTEWKTPFKGGRDMKWNFVNETVFSIKNWASLFRQLTHGKHSAHMLRRHFK